jgi:hypothetical protein
MVEGSSLVGPPLAGGLLRARTGFRYRLWGHPLRLAGCSAGMGDGLLRDSRGCLACDFFRRSSVFYYESEGGSFLAEAA